MAFTVSHKKAPRVLGNDVRVCLTVHANGVAVLDDGNTWIQLAAAPACESINAAVGRFVLERFAGVEGVQVGVPFPVSETEE